jgi:RNA polymerase sigma-70 factor (ECF subfamily)
MAELVAAVEQPLMAFILRYVGDRHTAEDVFQDTFVRVMEHIGSFRPQARLSTWIFAIARNLCMDHLRGRRRRREVAEDAAAVVPFPGTAPGEDAGRTEARRLVHEAIRSLSPAKREALILRFFSGKSYEEIAAIVRAPVGTVKFRVHDALRDLARRMREVPEGEEDRHDLQGSA